MVWLCGGVVCRGEERRVAGVAGSPGWINAATYPNAAYMPGTAAQQHLGH